MHRYSSGPSEDTAFSCSYFRLHHCFQHHFSSTPNFLSPTRKHDGHPSHQILPYSSSFPPIHPLHHAHLRSASVRCFLRTFHSQIHRPCLWDLTFAADRLWPLLCNIFYGFSCPHGEEEKGLCCELKWNNFYFLDHSTVLDLRIIGDVYRCRPHWVLLQTVYKRDASFLNRHNLLFLLIWILFELRFGFSCQ